MKFHSIFGAALLSGARIVRSIANQAIKAAAQTRA